MCECSQAIADAAKEAKDSNLSTRDSLRKVGAASLSSREVSAQECVYRCMPEIWLRKFFPQVVYVNTDLPEKRIRAAKTQQELDELEDDSTHLQIKYNRTVYFETKIRSLLLIGYV